MRHLLIKKAFPLIAAAFLIGTDSVGVGEVSAKAARRYFAEQQEETVLNVYNWEDYILPDTKDDNGNVTEKGLISKFEDYCLDTLGKNVRVNYSTFDTNETMLSELKTGKAQYDLICPSDYIIQKMIADDLIVPYDEGSTPNYDKYVSPFIRTKITEVPVKGKTGVVNSYARGYMWGTLGILFNDTYRTLAGKGITSKEMDKDMHSWLSLWDEKYKNLLSIKDSVRDTYAVGIMKAYDQDFTIDDKSYQGFSTLESLYNDGKLTQEEYSAKVTEIFNLCDDTTIERVGNELKTLKANAFGFEVDSGKTDMAAGNKFAINVAWSGDAAFAMDNADEINSAHENEEGFTPTILKYALPDTGANVWFDGWVMPKNVQNKETAEAFVDFLSTPKYTAQNMDYIGYTSVIAGDEVLNLVESWYDLRWNADLNDGEGGIDPEATKDLTLVKADEIADLSEDEIADSYYEKDVGYFFKGTLKKTDESLTTFCLTADMKDRQFDTQYPDATVLPKLAVMADFGTQNPTMLTMWENVKNTAIPIWVYVLVCAIILLVIIFIISDKAKKAGVMRRRKERKLLREMKTKKSIVLTKTLTEGLLGKPMISEPGLAPVSTDTQQIPVVDTKKKR
jgi:spermidine/putrescine transport system substrate-binding protein